MPRTHLGDSGRASYVMLAVSDTGRGMTAGDQGAHLRALLHHQGPGKGTGLGAFDGVRDREAVKWRYLGLFRAR